MRRVLWAAIAALFICAGVAGQGTRFKDTALKPTAAIPGATITVGTENSAGTPLSPLANIFSDKALTIAKSNPFTADAQGNFGFYAEVGCYKLQISAPGYTTFTETVCKGTEVGASSVTFSATPTFDSAQYKLFRMTLTGNVTSSTISNAVTGRVVYFNICQDATGSRTFAWPASVLTPPTVGTAASSCTSASFIYDGTNWRELAPSSRGSAVFDSTTVGKLNNILFVDGVKYATLAAGYAALPATGGVIGVPPNYTETLSADLTIAKPDTVFLFFGPATITMGTNRIIVTQGTHGVAFKSTSTMGGALSKGVRWNYSGTGSAFLVGGVTTTTRNFGWSNMTVVLSSPAANSTGLTLNNTVYFELDNPSVVGNDTNGRGIVLDGTGNFTGTGRILNPYLVFLATGLLGTGSGANAMNAVTIIGGTIQSNAAGAIGINIDVGDGNSLVGVDIESNSVGVKLGAGANNNFGWFRSEANTTDIQALAGSVGNSLRAITEPAETAVVVSDSGTRNSLTRLNDISAEVFFSTVNQGGGTLLGLAATTAQKYIELSNTGNIGFYFGIESSVGGAFFTGSNAYESVLFSQSNDLFLKTPIARFSGDAQILTPGSASASVVTLGAAQTLTNKTLNSPVINIVNSATDCTSNASPAACGSSASGSFVIAAAATSVVVNTTAVTANSKIFVQEDSSLSTKLGVTCNTQSILVLGPPVVTARTAATSFTATIVVAPTTNPACYNYWIVGP